MSAPELFFDTLTLAALASPCITFCWLARWLRDHLAAPICDGYNAFIREAHERSASFRR